MPEHTNAQPPQRAAVVGATDPAGRAAPRGSYTIPVIHGIAAARIAQRYPGLAWREVFAVLRAADVIEVPIARGPLRIDPAVHSIHFSDVDTWVVEWVDGSVTRSRAA